ncbi:hypothetical protein Hanom_Chr10g00909051 [Helianthus anomalus]
MCERCNKNLNHSNQAYVLSATFPTNTKPFSDSGNGQVCNLAHTRSCETSHRLRIELHESVS